MRPTELRFQFILLFIVIVDTPLSFVLLPFAYTDTQTHGSRGICVCIYGIRFDLLYNKLSYLCAFYLVCKILAARQSKVGVVRFQIKKKTTTENTKLRAFCLATWCVCSWLWGELFEFSIFICLLSLACWMADPKINFSRWNFSIGFAFVQAPAPQTKRS